MAESMVPAWLKKVTGSINYDSGTGNKGWHYTIYAQNQVLVGLHSKCPTTVVAWSSFRILSASSSLVFINRESPEMVGRAQLSGYCWRHNARPTGYG